MNSVFVKRRLALAARMGAQSLGASSSSSVAVFPSAPVFVRNRDVEHPYRQDSDFFYLTGFDEPECVLVILSESQPGKQPKSVLFLRDRNPERETWDGLRLGVERAAEALGVDAAYAIDTLQEHLPALLVGSQHLYASVGKEQRHFFEASLLEALEKARRKAQRGGPTAPITMVDPSCVLHEMRLFKDSDEVQTMRRAAAISCEAHRRAMTHAKPGMFEYELTAELEYVFRRSGAERPAYECIVGSGSNATVLHHRRNDRKMNNGDLVLIDAGCEYAYYAADITRTFPVNGRFSKEQSEVYTVVLQAQRAAINTIRPGVTLEDIHNAAVRVLTQGLIHLGLLEATLEEAINTKLYRRYYMHQTSHWLGMDVHDVGAYTLDGKARPLEPGMVLTVEPGLYIATDDIHESYRGIGVRIEDDILVTKTGYENLTEQAPKTIEDIEALMSIS